MTILRWTAIAAVLLTGGCGFSSCGLTALPQGFPAAERSANAVQLRITATGLTAMADAPQNLLGLLGTPDPTNSDAVDVAVPPACGGSPAVCCPGGLPQAGCGPLSIDLGLRALDAPRLELHPAAGASRVDLVVRARLQTLADLPADIPAVGLCGLAVYTIPGPTEDVVIHAPLSFVQDATSSTTRIVVGTITIDQLTTDDVRLTGGIGCQTASLGLGAFLDTLVSTITEQLQSAIQTTACKPCASGDVGECGSFATACDDEVCQIGPQCLQELGLVGRAGAATLFPGLAPGGAGTADVYAIAGGYATTNNNGVALGQLGGVVPSGAARNRCGPTATPPPSVPIAPSAFFQGNTRPDTADIFDVGIGIHKSHLDALAYAAYESGLLCMDVSGGGAEALSTNALTAIAPSAAKLVDAGTPLIIGWRPQGPPALTMGLNVFASGTLTEPLVDAAFDAMEIDVFASVEEQYVRMLTVVADVHLPIGLSPGAVGHLTVVMPSASDAFTSVSIKGSEVLAESPATLAPLLDALLGAARDQLAGGVRDVTLPTIFGYPLRADAVTAVDSLSYLGIFATVGGP